MLRIPYSGLWDPDCGFVAWSLRMRRSRFPDCTQKGTPQREALHMLSKEDIQGMGKTTSDDGIYSWHDLLAKREPLWSLGESSPGLTEMPTLTIHNRREMLSPLTQLHVTWGLGYRGVRRAPAQESRDWVVTPPLGCVTQSETLPLSESYFFIHQI